MAERQVPSAFKGAGGFLSLQPGVVANWPLDRVRYFGIDSINGDDSFIGYIDAAPGAILNFAGMAKRTLAGMLAILPEVGAGRLVVILIKGGTYAEALDLAGYTGYMHAIVRASDLTNSAADKAMLEAVTVTAGPNVDGSWTVAAGATALAFDVAAGALPIVGYQAWNNRIRFKGNVTAALANINANALTNDVNTIGPSIAIRSELFFDGGLAPAAGDEFFLERPGVIITGRFHNWGDSLSNECDWDVQGIGAIFAGLQFTKDDFFGIDLSAGSGTYSFAFCDFSAASDTTTIYAGSRVACYYFDPFWYDETLFLSTGPTGPGIFGAQSAGTGAIFRAPVRIIGAQLVYERASAFLPTDVMTPHKIQYMAMNIVCGIGGRGAYRCSGVGVYVGSCFPGEDSSSYNKAVISSVVGQGTNFHVRFCQYIGADRINFTDSYNNDIFRYDASAFDYIYVYGVDFINTGAMRGTNIDLRRTMRTRVYLGFLGGGTVYANTYAGAAWDVITSTPFVAMQAGILAADLNVNSIIDPNDNYICGNVALRDMYAQAIALLPDAAMAPGDVIQPMANEATYYRKAQANLEASCIDARAICLTTALAGCGISATAILACIQGAVVARFDAAVTDTGTRAAYVSASTSGRLSQTRTVRTMGIKDRAVVTPGGDYALVFLSPMATPYDWELVDVFAPAINTASYTFANLNSANAYRMFGIMKGAGVVDTIIVQPDASATGVWSAYLVNAYIAPTWVNSPNGFIHVTELDATANALATIRLDIESRCLTDNVFECEAYNADPVGSIFGSRGRITTNFTSLKLLLLAGGNFAAGTSVKLLRRYINIPIVAS